MDGRKHKKGPVYSKCLLEGEDGIIGGVQVEGGSFD